MNFLKITALAALLATASVAPVYAGGTHCYSYGGKLICCTTLGNYTSCT
jgi:hypothetical protein